MIDELIRQQARLQRQTDGLIMPEMSKLLVSPFLDLPGRVGLWYAGGVQRSTGNIYDAGGQARTLTYNGNPTFNQISTGIAYADLDGTGDYFSRADETDLDILGTETIYNSAVRGLTMGGWFYAPSLPGGDVGLIAKDDGATNRCYLTFLQATGAIGSQVSIDGSTMTTVTSTALVTAAQWFFTATVFKPSTSLSNFVNLIKTTNTTSIPASIFNGSSILAVGSLNGANLFTGRVALCFLCANALPDAMISSLFQQTRGLFGI